MVKVCVAYIKNIANGENVMKMATLLNNPGNGLTEVILGSGYQTMGSLKGTNWWALYQQLIVSHEP